MITTFNSQTSFNESLLNLLISANQNNAKIIKVFDYDLHCISSKIFVDELRKYFLSSIKNKIYTVLYDEKKIIKDYARLNNEFRQFSYACEFYNLQKNRDQLDDAFILIDNQDLIIRPNRQAFHGSLYVHEPEFVSVYINRFAELIESSDRVSLFTLGL